MLAKKRINHLLFLSLTLVLALVLAYQLDSVALGIFTMTQYGAFFYLYKMVLTLLYKERKSGRARLVLFLLKIFLTVVPFSIIGIFYKEKLLGALLSYILVLLIFFISIKKDE